MIRILLFLASLLTASTTQGPGPGPCKSGAPDIPAVTLSPFSADKYLGIYYTHAFRSSTHGLPQNGNCLYTNTTKIKSEGSDIYLKSDLMFHHPSANGWIKIMDLIIKLDANNPNSYIVLDENLKPDSSASAGRIISAKDKYTIDYGWHLRNGTSSGECECEYHPDLWSITSRSKILSQNDYNEALAYLDKLNLTTSGVEKIRQDCPGEP